MGREVGTPLNSNTERGEVEVQCPGNAELVSVGEVRRSEVGANQTPQDGQVRQEWKRGARRELRTGEDGRVSALGVGLAEGSR